MPRDSNGIYSLPPGYLGITGETIITSQHNPPLEDIAAALTGSLPRNGSAPMDADLKMGGFKVTGLANGVNPQDAVAFGQIIPTAQIVTLTGAQTLTNKTLTSPTINGGSWTGGTDLAIADGGTGAGTALAAFTALKQAATEASTGVVELATAAEAAAGADTTRAVTSAGVLAAVPVRTAALAVGAIGTYALLADATGAGHNPGDTVAGANLRYTNVVNDTGAAPAGTWRCMGNTVSGAIDRTTTLWLRIS